LTLAQIVANRPELSYLSNLLGDDDSLDSISASESSLPSLAHSRHLTFFAPSNAAFHQRFDPLELKYLESDFGYEGIRRVVVRHLVSTAEADKERDLKGVKGVVGWRREFEWKHGQKSRKTQGQ
jgi:uncharacterized surface protein with fasciclin (FAS1) repeats